ncbi:hypothetical protein [Muribaculum intestinale]|uniref:hypothetical protein n=1 Tax=Muribaculum intestinale TaxID=1796646 RepID=UPI0012B884D1|nr:hypothetical protein [Muribaculum intestinale]
MQTVGDKPLCEILQICLRISNHRIGHDRHIHVVGDINRMLKRIIDSNVVYSQRYIPDAVPLDNKPWRYYMISKS